MKKMLGLLTALLITAGSIGAAQLFTSDDTTDPVNEIPFEPRAEIQRESPIALDPAAGAEIGLVYETYLSPQQEGEDESDTPDIAPAVFRSTAPSVPREERDSRGHAVLEFTNDFSRVYIHLAIENVNPEDIVMMHIHCGRPGQLGPILIDFGLHDDVADLMADERLTFELRNADIDATVAAGHGVVGAFTAGCPIVPTIPADKVKTLAGMAYIAQQGDLYFNLHTAGQTFFGDIRGQFHPADMQP